MKELAKKAINIISQNLSFKDWFAIALAFVLTAWWSVAGGSSVVFQLLLLVLAVFLLMYGSDWVIQGASAIGLIFGMTLFAIGVLFVSPGTTFPELFTNLNAVSAGVNNVDFAIGNAVGSYTFNTLGIVGCASLMVLLPFFSGRIKSWLHKRSKKEFADVLNHDQPAVVDVPKRAAVKTLFAMGSVVLLFVLSMDGVLAWYDGIILLVGFALWLVYVAKDMKAEQKNQPEEENEFKGLNDKHRRKERNRKIAGSIIVMAIGIISLIYGAKFLVSSSASLAKMAGLSDAFIGLTIVAMGTSAPEFAVSVSAVAKKRYALGIGNIIGADILDVLMVLGASSIFRTLIHSNGVPFNTNAMYDVIAAFLAMGLLGFTLACIKPRHKLTWWKGIILLLPYIAYVIYILGRK